MGGRAGGVEGVEWQLTLVSVKLTFRAHSQSLIAS